MRVSKLEEYVVVVELTRRNLETLLAKLDDPESQRTIFKDSEPDEGEPFLVYVRGVEDAEHYSDRAPGIVYSPGTGQFQ